MTDISAGVACQTAGVLKADVALAIADTFLAVAFTCNGPTLNYVWGKKNKQCQTMVSTPQTLVTVSTRTPLRVKGVFAAWMPR